MRKDAIDGTAYVANHGPHRWGIHWYDATRKAWWEPQSFHCTKRAAVEAMHETHEHNVEREAMEQEQGQYGALQD